jgi:hypothetical protein
MEAHPFDPPDAERCQAIVVLQPPELALDGSAAAVQVGPLRGAALDRRLGLDAALAEGITGAMPRSWRSAYTLLLS